MKKIILISSLFLAISSFAQSAKPYWAILTNESAVNVKQGSIADLMTFSKSSQASQYPGTSWQNVSGIIETTLKKVTFGSREAVLVIDSLDDGVIFAIDPLGRFIYIKGKVLPVVYSSNKTTPGVALLTANFTLETGKKLSAGLFLWCCEIDTDSEKAIIQIGASEFIKVPLSKLNFLRSSYSELPKSNSFEDVNRK